MKKQVRKALVAGLLLLGGCQTINSANVEPVVAGNCSICGTWSYTYPDQSATQKGASYKRTNALADAPGFTFRPDGQFVERANSGWCGTPPVSYSDYPGSWRMDGDSLLIEGRYWGGPQRSKIAIVSLKADRLVIVRVYKR